MSTIVVSPFNVVNAPGIGGHFWVYVHYVLGLQLQGCEVFWLERFLPTADSDADQKRMLHFLEATREFGLEGKVILYKEEATPGHFSYLTTSQEAAEATFRRAECLLNFHYSAQAELLAKFSRTALIDIDPGLLQFWAGNGQIQITKHDLYFTTGETVGTPTALFPDCGIDWIHIHPAVCLEHWPYVNAPERGAFTTVSSWWGGGGSGEFITDGKGLVYENNKRYSFLRFIDLPRRTTQPLELTLFLDETNPPEAGSQGEKRLLGRKVGPWDPHYDGLEMFRYTGDREDRQLLESYGWRIRHSREAAGTPSQYKEYIQTSRGEFSAAKPSCMAFRNAWVSDRTLCYLSSGRPVVVQDTGPSRILPTNEGMFRFQTVEEAAEALDSSRAHYERHRRAARDLAETYFDSKKVVATILNAVRTAQKTSVDSKLETASVDSQIADCLFDGLSRELGRKATIRHIERQRFANASSFAIETLQVTLDDDTQIPVFFKDLNPENQLIDARRVRSLEMERSVRELEVYRRILSRKDFGTPKMYAYRWDAERGLYWLFLEFVEGKKVSKLADPAVWEASARAVARFHHASQSVSIADCPFLPWLDENHYWECFTKVRDKISSLKAKDRQLAEEGLELYRQAIPALLKLPQSLIHGEYFGKNIMFGPSGSKICIVDWETAAWGPSFLDIASLSTGDWSLEEKTAMRRAYFEEYRTFAPNVTWEMFLNDVEMLGLYQAIRWIGWWPGEEGVKQFGRWMNELERVLQHTADSHGGSRTAHT